MPAIFLCFAFSLFVLSNYCLATNSTILHSHFTYTPDQTDWLDRSYPLSLTVYYSNLPGNGKKPVVILGHGGGFLCGNRSGSLMTELCTNLAKEGFLAVSIDYRKGWINNDTTRQMALQGATAFLSNCPTVDYTSCFCGGPYSGIDCSGDGGSLLEAVYRGIQDGNSAVRFVRSKIHDWNVDTSQIFFGGFSAGGTIGLHLAFSKEEHFPDSIVQKLGPWNVGWHLDRSSSVRGVLNFWGGFLYPDSLITQHRTSLLMVHGTCDKVVPYHKRRFYNCSVYPMVYGSHALFSRFQQLEDHRLVRLITGCGYTHNFLNDCYSGEFLEEVYDSILVRIIQFYQETTQFPSSQKPPVKDVKEEFFPVKSCYCGDCGSSFAFPNPACQVLAAPLCHLLPPPIGALNPYVPGNPCFLPTTCYSAPELSPPNFEEKSIFISPNPATQGNVVAFRPKMDLNDVQVRLTDTAGRTVFQSRLKKILEGETIKLPLSETLTPGIYFLVIQSEGFRETSRIMVSY